MLGRSLLVGLLGLALAGCAGGTVQTSSPAPSGKPAIAPSTGPAPAESLVILGVTVHWDGTRCTYIGPTVIQDGTTARFEYTFDEGTDPPLLFVGGIVAGTTWETIVDYVTAHPASEAPDWVVLRRSASIDPGTSALLTIGGDIVGEAVGGYFVGCATAPADQGGTDKMYPAALLLIARP